MTSRDFTVPLQISAEDTVSVEQMREYLADRVRLDLDLEETGPEDWCGVGLSIDWGDLRTQDYTGRILVAIEKHGTRYFDASTTELLTVASLRLLRERLADGYYTPGSPPTGTLRTREEIAALADDLKEAAEQTNRRLRRELAQHRRDVEFLAEVQRALADFAVASSVRGKRANGYPLAFTLLADRGDAEYEQVDLVEPDMAFETRRPSYMSCSAYYAAEQAGWAIFDRDGRDQVQRLDERDVLESDKAAWALARAAGLSVDAEGYVVGVDSQESETGDDSSDGDGD